MVMRNNVTASVCEESPRPSAPSPYRASGPPDRSAELAQPPAPPAEADGTIAAGGRGGELALAESRSPAVADLNTPAALEPSGSQWAIKLPDGRVIPTGTCQERTERDAEWENNNPQGRGGCSAVVCDAYRTPWRLADDPAPIVAPDDQARVAQAAEVAALHAQVTHLVDLIRHYRHLATDQVNVCPLPSTHAQDRWARKQRRSRARVSAR